MKFETGQMYLQYLLFNLFSLTLALSKDKFIVVNNGIYFKEIRSLRPYHLTIPILFKTKLPNSDGFTKNFEIPFHEIEQLAYKLKTDTYTNIKTNFEHLIKNYEVILHDFHQTPLRN